MDGTAYRFELRRADEILATGHLNPEAPLEVGDRIEIARRQGIVRTIEPMLGQPEMRLVMQVLEDR
jgi:hypothetical protein